MTTGIEIQNLSFQYEGGVEALRNISLAVQQGETIALLGHNGSGKSTLVKHLNGLLRPSQGIVKINGIITADQRTAQLASMAALLFQNPDDQICKGSVWKEMLFGPRNLGYDDNRTHELANRFLSAFDLLEMKDCNPHDLGLSERKRLAIASVFAMDTGIVVLDEPTAGLDHREISLLKTAILQLKLEQKTLVIISHDMDFIAENTSRAICLEKGSKQFDGSTLALFNNPGLLEQCSLLPPQVAQLASQCDIRLNDLTPKGFLEELIAT